MSCLAESQPVDLDSVYKLAADSNENAKQPKVCENCTDTFENSEKLTQSEDKAIETKVDIHIQHIDKKPSVAENNDYLKIWSDITVPDSPPPPLPPRTYKHKPLERTWAMLPTTEIRLDALRQLKPKSLLTDSSDFTNVSPVAESKAHRPLTRASSRAGDHVNMKCSVQKTLSNDNREHSRFMMLTDENRKPRRTESRKDTTLPPGKILYYIL